MSEWISVEDRLPDDEQDVIVTDGKFVIGAKFERYDTGPGAELDGYFTLYGWDEHTWDERPGPGAITFWMPRPSLPATVK